MSENVEITLGILALTALLSLAGFGGYVAGSVNSEIYWKNQMAEKKVGEYYLDENHNKCFRIIEVK